MPGPGGRAGSSVETHQLAYLAKGASKDGLAAPLDGLSLVAGAADGADVMLFAGEPIGAPVKAEGTMVMNTDQELRMANRVKQRSQFEREREVETRVVLCGCDLCFAFEALYDVCICVRAVFCLS